MIEKVYIGVKGFVKDFIIGFGLENVIILVVGINYNIIIGRFGDFY